MIQTVPSSQRYHSGDTRGRPSSTEAKKQNSGRSSRLSIETSIVFSTTRMGPDSNARPKNLPRRDGVPRRRRLDAAGRFGPRIYLSVGYHRGNVRLVQLTIPAGKRETILDALDDEEVDYVVTDETSGREFTGVVYFPLPANAVEPVLDRLQEEGVSDDAYTV